MSVEMWEVGVKIEDQVVFFVGCAVWADFSVINC